MVTHERFFDRSKNIITLQEANEKTLDNLRKGTLIGVARSIILEYTEKFNLFNKLNEFEFRMGDADIKHYKNGISNIPNDLRCVGTFSDKEDTGKFVQVFMPSNINYIVIDHILGGEGNGEYDRDFSQVEMVLLEWYYNFFNEYISPESPLLYESNFDIRGAFPMKMLFNGLNIIVAYVPLLLYGEIISEVVIRINLEALRAIIESRGQSGKGTEHGSNAQFYNVGRMLTDDELDEIIEKIIRQ